MKARHTVLSTTPCPACNGAGIVNTERTLESLCEELKNCITVAEAKQLAKYIETNDADNPPSPELALLAQLLRKIDA